MMDKVLITGASGFVGTHLADDLSKDFNVIRFTRKNTLQEIEIIKPEYIIHCAAEIYKKELMFESNVILTHNLLEICKKLPMLKQFIYIGSSSEYGRKTSPISESDVLNPDSMYEGTKACGSLLTIVYGKTYSFLTSVVRPFSLYGPGEQDRKFIPKLYQAFTTDAKISIGPGVHDWIHIQDFIRGVKAVMTKNAKTGEIYHFGTGVQTSNLEVLHVMERVMKKTIEYETANNNFGSAGVDSSCWVANVGKVKDVFGWYPLYNLESGIQSYVNYKRYGNN